MQSKKLYWPVSLLPAGATHFTTAILLFMFVWIGYFLYFNAPILSSKIRGKKSGQTLWGVKEHSVQEIYEFLKPSGFVTDHIVYSILTPVYATAFTILIVGYYLIYGVMGYTEQSQDSSLKLLEAALGVSFIITYSSIP